MKLYWKQIQLTVLILSSHLCVDLSFASSRTYSSLPTAPQRPRHETDSTWTAWKLKYWKHYGDLRSEINAYSKWKANSDRILSHNVRSSAGAHLYEKHVNSFADRLAAEVLAQLTSTESEVEDNQGIRWVTFPEPSLAPGRVDWREWIHTVKVQPEQSSRDGDLSQWTPGWLSAAVEVVQAQYFVQTRREVILSVQEIQECLGLFGYQQRPMVNVFWYIMQQGVSLKSDYSVPSVSRRCLPERRKPVDLKMQAVHRIKTGDEENLKRAVALMGPVAASIFAGENFVFYGSGIFLDKYCKRYQPTNHAVLIVGYGTDKKGVDFWILKNNWGRAWGEGGYMRLRRNSQHSCGITTAAYYPVFQPQQS